MRHEGHTLLNSIIGKIAVLLCAVSLLIPSSVCVLCKAPDHVAIEDLNAECCAPSETLTQTDPFPGSGFDMADNCRDCTDLLISLDERGVNSKANDETGNRSFLGECFGDRVQTGAYLYRLRQNTPDVPNASPPVSSMMPLRC